MSEEFKCASCEKAIDGRALMVGGGYFCPTCFVLVCTACKDELKGSFLEKDSKHYCVPCYHDNFSPKCAECSKSITGPVLSMGGKNFCPECFKCDFCLNPIKPNEGLSMRKEKRCCVSCKPHFCGCGCGEYCPETNRIVIDGIQKPLLLECLKCKSCRKQLYKNDVKVFNSKVFCEGCVQKERESTVDLSQPCAKCDQKITGKALLALDKQWCADCFVCTYEDCGIKLSGKFFDIDGMPYCEECKKKPKKKPQELLGGQSSSDDVLPPIPTNTDGGDDDAPEYAEVDDACTDVAVADNEPDYDNHDFANLPPPPARLSGNVDIAETSADYDCYEMAQKPEAPPPPPMLSDSSDTYDNSEHGAAGDDTYDNADHVVGAQRDDTYDNADHAVPAVPGEDDYDNADHGTVPSADDTYDNAEHGSAPQLPATCEDTYDNNEYAVGGVATENNEYALPADSVSMATPGVSDAEVEKRVRERMDIERREMERKIREQIEREMRDTSAVAAAAPLATTGPSSSAPPHLQHQPNPLYQSADDATQPQHMSPEKDLLSSWMGKKPEPGSASPGTQRKLKQFTERRELPKPRTMSARVPSSSAQ